LALADAFFSRKDPRPRARASSARSPSRVARRLARAVFARDVREGSSRAFAVSAARSSVPRPALARAAIGEGAKVAPNKRKKLRSV
jgi:hypothetical protein